jgi:hypothetical protein
LYIGLQTLLHIVDILESDGNKSMTHPQQENPEDEAEFEEGGAGYDDGEGNQVIISLSSLSSLLLSTPLYFSLLASSIPLFPSTSLLIFVI